MIARRLRRGASALEFALLCPVVAAVVSGVVDLGWYLHESQLAAQVVREGAHVGAGRRLDAVPGPADAAELRVQDTMAAMGMDTSALTVETSYQNLLDLGACDTDDTLTVTVSFPFEPIVGMFPIRPTITASLATLLVYSDCMP